MNKTIPTKKQLEFLDWEIGVFFHFGIRTFNEGHKDWDGEPMAVETFNPTSLDCEQWIKTAKAGGAKYTILTTKHHDGFALWPSAYTDYCVKNTPWKDGKGDVVREYVDACRKYDIKVGLYYSPAQFGSKSMQGKEYDDYFINQISELLSNYGKIDYLWFDGCGSEDHEYDKDRIIKAIRGLQPEILIFSMWDPDTRWVGNEEGITPIDCKNTVAAAKTSINEQEAQWLSEPKFLPYECDCKIRPNNWFYSENDADTLRSLDNLLGLYDYSVGRGGNLLLNIGPDRRGLLPEKDAERFIEFGKAVKEQFSAPVDITVEKEGDVYTISSEKTVDISTVVIKENLENGEGVKGFSLEYNYFVDMSLYCGKTIGNKRIVRIPAIGFGGDKKLKLKITDFDGEYTIDDIKVYPARNVNKSVNG